MSLPIQTKKKPWLITAGLYVKKGYFKMGYSYILSVRKPGGDPHIKVESGYFPIMSAHQAKLKVIQKILSEIKVSDSTKITVTIETEDEVLSSNINKNLFNWSKNDWLTKTGTIPKYVDDYKKIHSMLIPGTLYLYSSYKRKAEEFTLNRLELEYLASLEADSISVSTLIRYKRSVS